MFQLCHPHPSISCETPLENVYSNHSSLHVLQIFRGHVLRSFISMHNGNKQKHFKPISRTLEWTERDLQDPQLANSLPPLECYGHSLTPSLLHHQIQQAEAVRVENNLHGMDSTSLPYLMCLTYSLYICAVSDFRSIQILLYAILFL